MKTILRVSLIIAVVLILLAAVGVNYAVENILPYSPIRPHRCTRDEMSKYTPDLLSPAAFTSKWARNST